MFYILILFYKRFTFLRYNKNNAFTPHAYMPIQAFAGVSENHLPASSNEQSAWLVFKCFSRCSVFLPDKGLCNNYQEGSRPRNERGAPCKLTV